MKPTDTLMVTTPTECELVMTRVFAAPRQRVFDAWTKPELLLRWFGPPGWSLVVCEIELVVGGTWRFVMRNQKGAEMELRGVYREIVPGERLVYSQWIAGCEAQGKDEALVSSAFTEKGGKTTFTCTVRYPTREIRDAAANSGARGIGPVYDKLAELLAATA